MKIIFFHLRGRFILLSAASRHMPVQEHQDLTTITLVSQAESCGYCNRRDPILISTENRVEMVFFFLDIMRIHILSFCFFFRIMPIAIRIAPAISPAMQI